MNIKTLVDIPPWQWPNNADEIILGVLRNDQADASDGVRSHGHGWRV